MSYTDWRTPARLLTQKMAPATQPQQEFAALLDLIIEPTTPQLVAAAVLTDASEPFIHGTCPRPASEAQLGFLRSLHRERSFKNVTARVASAWIDYYLAERSVRLLHELRPQRGNVVRRIESATETHVTVSSIGANGRVYFMGGGGHGAWPSELNRVTITEEQTSQEKAV